MIDFGVSPEKQKELSGKMQKFGIKESDIIENFIRSAGPGGQNVNKTSTAVYLKHLPTGIEVKCQNTRSQSLNRYFARKILVQKIEDQILGRLSSEKQKIEKIKRQKRKRSKRAKEKTLALKKQKSEIKKSRKHIKELYNIV
ncbi:MAG: peptide chain release factor-like protein [Candidatus Omnitrophica bacterium]|jgi:protein subunit release factor B|nr:peptide chain release factor-like protein [Candidatus Omnitrophota bacterium]